MSNNTISRDHEKDLPLCVDLDGTLVRSDMLIESALMLLKQQPHSIFAFPLWLLKGKATLKHEIAQRVDLSAANILYNEEIVEYVRHERQQRETVLVTGSNQKIANLIARDTALFDHVHGSSEETNLTHLNKRDFLVQEFGENGFDYIGNDKDDYSVWPSARHALAVSTADGVISNKDIAFKQVFDIPTPTLGDYFNLLRVHQWLKNGLVLVPFALDHSIDFFSSAVTITLAFFAMSLLASMTYIFNDMLDLQADRQNSTKRHRAIASGRVSLVAATQTMLLLALATLALTFFLPVQFNLILLAYLLSTLWYTVYLKQVAILDVCMIAALHTLRIIGGTVAISAAWSFWLLAFSMFIFFSLAVAKRVAELTSLKAAGIKRTLGRDYQVDDIPVLTSSGVATGFISVLVVALYINTEKVSLMYSTPQFLWLLCPVFMYWIGRIWLKTGRGEMHEDPIIFALRDRVSLIAATLVVLSVFAAKLI